MLQGMHLEYLSITGLILQFQFRIRMLGISRFIVLKSVQKYLCWNLPSHTNLSNILLHIREKMSMTHSFSGKVIHAGNELRFSCSNSLQTVLHCSFLRAYNKKPYMHACYCMYRTVVIIFWISQSLRLLRDRWYFWCRVACIKYRLLPEEVFLT